MTVLLDFVVETDEYGSLILVHATCGRIVEQWGGGDMPMELPTVVAAANDHSCPDDPSYSTLRPNPIPHR